MKIVVVSSEEDKDLFSFLSGLRPQKTIYKGNVPCNGCTLCCKQDIPVTYTEWQFYKWKITVSDSGEGFLQRTPEGDCVYLKEDECSIYGDTPSACKRFDCREAASTIDKNSLKNEQLIKIWEKGRSFLNH